MNSNYTYTLRIGPGTALFAGLALGALYETIRNRYLRKEIALERNAVDNYIINDVNRLFGTLNERNITEEDIAHVIPQENRVLFNYIHEYVLKVLEEQNRAFNEGRNMNHSGGPSPLPTPSFSQIAIYEHLLRTYFNTNVGHGLRTNVTRRASPRGARRRTSNKLEQ